MASAASVATAPWVNVAVPDNVLINPTGASSARADSPIAQRMATRADQAVLICAAFLVLDEVRSSVCQTAGATTFPVLPSGTACGSPEILWRPHRRRRRRHRR